MAIALKQSTASQEIPLGPFLDITDGNTPETGLSPANTDIKIWKNGATTLADKNSGGATHISGGIYYAVLDATDTDTLGPLVVYCHISATALPVKVECVVLPANVYDSTIAASDKLQVDVAEWLGTAVATPSVAGVPEVDITHVAGATTDVSALATNVAAILVDTAVIGTPAGASLSADIAAIEAQTDDIGAAGAGLTAIPWNAAWDAEVQSEVEDGLDVQLADSIPADGTRPTLRQALYMVTQFLMERSVSGTTMTVRKVDGSTALMTLTLSDATNPTSITRAT